MEDEQIEKILEEEITEEDYQFTEKGFEPEFITKNFAKKYKERRKFG